MLKAVAPGKNGKRVVFVGLSRKNIEHLMNDKPIKFDGRDVLLPGNIFVIFFAETEEDMRIMFEEKFGKDVVSEFTTN